MITRLLFIGFFTVSTVTSFGQMTSMTLEGSTDNLSGLTHTINITNGDEQLIDILAHNNSGGDLLWYVTRKRITAVPADWTDFLCWGVEGDPFGGTCYEASADNPWSSGAKNIPASEAGLIAIHINPSDLASGSCRYRYYIGEEIEFPQDSVDILVTTTTVAVKETNKVVNPILSTYPNPADNYLTVSLQSAQTEGYLRMTDVLGKVVLEEKIIGTKKVDVEEFKNGVYVLSLNSNGVNTTKRVVVRH